MILSRTKKPLVSTAAAVLTALVVASMALASPHPTGEFAQFAKCPLKDKAVTTCVYSVSDNGSFTIGEKTVPFSNPVTFQGGFSGSGQSVKSLGAVNGEMLEATPQPVPGGLRGITAPASWPASLRDWFNEQIAKGVTGVTATLELAAPAAAVKLSTENLLNSQGTALGLPVKIRLENPLLGPNCYIGSNSSPIQLNLTSGKSGAVTGSFGKLQFNKKYTLTTITGGRLVNGTFAAPPARGCGGIFSYFIDPLVDSALGLPSPSGKNTAVLEGKLQAGTASAIRESETR